MKALEELKISCGFSPHQVLLFLSNPKFEETVKIHDWRNHVSYELRSIWGKLSEESRMSIYIMAKNLADNEEWE